MSIAAISGPVVLGFIENRKQAEQLAAELGMPYGKISLHRFPDGEHRLSVPTPLPTRVIIYLSLDDPNEKLIELLLAAAAARDNGAEELLLVAPYLCYMRQDIAFHPGEAVSQQVIGKLLAEHFDAVVTVDPHLHRIQQLRQAIPLAHALALTAADVMAAYLSERFESPLLLGPDGESRQWVETIALKQGFDFSVGTKERFGDRHVRIHLPDDVGFAGRDVVIVDDIASTGRTMIAAAESVLAASPSSLSLLVTHALFAGDAEARIRALSIDNLWSTDSVSHSTNTIKLAPLLAGGVRSCL